MKATFKYDLDNPADVIEANRVFKSKQMANVLFEISMNLRKQCEWEIESLESDSDKWDGMDVVLRKINDLFEQNNINIDELIV